MSADEHSHCHSHKTHSSPESQVIDPNAVYTCPMHPEVRQIGPGSCPKCGMALEPLIAGAEESEELKDMTKRFFLAALFTIPLFIISMGICYRESQFQKYYLQIGKFTQS